MGKRKEISAIVLLTISSISGFYFHNWREEITESSDQSSVDPPAKAITFSPESGDRAEEDGFLTRRYYLPQGTERNNLEQYFSDGGVRFSDGASIELDEQTEEVVVSDRPYQHMMVRAVVEWSAKKDHQKTIAEKEAVEKNRQLLADLVIPKIEFENVPLVVALESLHEAGVAVLANEVQSATDLVPFGFGRDAHLLFTEEAFAEVKNTPITLRLQNIPLSEALRYTSSLAYLEYKVFPDKVGLEPVSFGADDMFTNVYMPPSGFAERMKQSEVDVKTVLVNAGIPFPLGTNAVFNHDTGQLIVRNYPDKQVRVREFLESTQMEWTEPMREEGRRKLVDLLVEARVPRIDWKEVPLGVAIQFLNQYVRKLDFEFHHTTFSGSPDLIRSEWKTREKGEQRITLRTANISLLDALLKTCELSGCQCEVDVDGITFIEE